MAKTKAGLNKLSGRTLAPLAAAGPKRVSAAQASGGSGYRFETAVQAAKLLALSMQLPVVGLEDDALILEIRFQARAHGMFTDDLVCTIRDSRGATSLALMQIKSGLTARASDRNFLESIGHAWLDVHRTDWGPRDCVHIIYDGDARHNMRGAAEIAESARRHLRATEWVHRVTARHSGNESKRRALAAVEAALNRYAGRIVDVEEVFSFLQRIYFVCHDLGAPDSQEYKQHLSQLRSQVKTPTDIDPSAMWAILYRACADTNAQGGAVGLSNLPSIVGARYAHWFSIQRAARSASDNAPRLMVANDERPSVAPAMSVHTGATRPDASALDEHLPEPTWNSSNSVVTDALNQVDALIKRTRYRDALAHVEAFTDFSSFDAHQRARWYLLRAVCRWHFDQLDAASADFMQAAEISEDDDKLAAARVRAHILREDLAGAKAAAARARQRYPNSLSVWLVAMNVAMQEGLALTSVDLPDRFVGEAEAWLLLAWSAFRQDDVRRAAELAVKASEMQPANFFAREAALGFAVHLAGSDGVKAGFRLLDSGEKALLARACARFSPRGDRLWNVQSFLVPGVVSNLAYAYLILGEAAEAQHVLVEANAFGITGPEVLRATIEVTAATGDSPRALALGLRNLDTLAPEGFVTLGQVAANAGDASTLRQLLDVARAKSFDAKAVNALQGQHWDAMLRAPDMRSVALAEIQATDPCAIDAVPLLVIGAHALGTYGAPGTADAWITRCLSLVERAKDSHNLYLAAMMLMDAKRYAEAACMLASFLPSAQYSELHRHELDALINSRQLRKARDLIQQFPPTWSDDPIARRLAINLAIEASDWQFMREVAEIQVREEPSDAASWLVKLSAVAQLDATELPAFVKTLPARLTGNVDELVRLAVAELRYGSAENGMRRLYRMRRSNPEGAESSAAYIAAIGTTDTALPFMDAALPAVTPGSSVTLVDGDGVKVVRSIDPAEILGLPPDQEFMTTTSADATRLLGLQAGSAVHVPGWAGSSKSYSVMSIQSAYRRLLDVSGAVVGSSLDPRLPIQAANIGTQSDGTPDLTSIRRGLEARAKHAAGAFATYAGSPVTLGMLGRLLGTDAADLVRSWPADATPLAIGTGQPTERSAALSALRRHDVAYVVDTSAIVELALLDCLHTLGQLPRAYVASRTLSLLRNKLEQARSTNREGVLFQHNGQLGFAERTAKMRDSEIQFFEAALTAVGRYCTVLPAYGPLDTAGLPLQLGRVLSDDEYSSVMLSLELGASLVSLDAHLQAIAGLLGVASIGAQMLLMHARDVRALSQRDYSVASIAMFLSNRSFVSLSDVDLAYMVYQGDAWLLHGINRFSEYLAAASTEFDSAQRVGLAVPRLLWNSGNCQLGVALQILTVLLAGLLRHPACPVDFALTAAHRLADVFGPNNSRFIPLAVDMAQREKAQRFDVRAKVLKIAAPPFLVAVDTRGFFEQSVVEKRDGLSNIDSEHVILEPQRIGARTDQDGTDSSDDIEE